MERHHRVPGPLRGRPVAAARTRGRAGAAGFLGRPVSRWAGCGETVGILACAGAACAMAITLFPLSSQVRGLTRLQLCGGRDGVDRRPSAFQVNHAKRYADLRKRTSPTSETALGGRCRIQYTPSIRQGSDPTQARGKALCPRIKLVHGGTWSWFCAPRTEVGLRHPPQFPWLCDHQMNAHAIGSDDEWCRRVGSTPGMSEP